MAATAAADAQDAAEALCPPPKHLLCPIGLHRMAEPVVASDGHTYERAQIAKWFAEGKRTSPMTGTVLPDLTSRPGMTDMTGRPDLTLTPNLVIRSQISEWLETSDAQRVAAFVMAVVLAEVKMPRNPRKKNDSNER